MKLSSTLKERRVFLFSILIKNSKFILLCLSLFLSVNSTFAQAYEGFGAVTGGGGGANHQTITIHTLAADGPGSLLETLRNNWAAGDNLTILFDVSGTIGTAEDPFRFDSNNEADWTNLTIDGSSAPSPGITLHGQVGSIFHFEGSENHDIIIKGLRLRGDPAEDCITIKGGAYNIMLDHLSVSGSHDGLIDITEGSHDVTVQYCIFGSGSSDWAGSMLIAYTPTKNISIHHNLFSCLTSGGVGERNAYIHSVNGSPGSDLMCDFRNNLVWKWGRYNGTASGYGTNVEYSASANIINNYYYSGFDPQRAVITNGSYPVPGSAPPGAAYVSGNFSGNSGIDPNTTSNSSVYTVPSQYTPATQDACTAAAIILANAGARPLDVTDQAIVDAVSLTGCPIKISVKAFLQGAYSSTLNRHKDVSSTWAGVLNATSGGALNQPYNISPFNYSGSESVSPGFFTSTSFTTDILDWVLIELRDATTPATIIARRAAFIREDGMVVDLDGSSDVAFSGVSPGNYYVTIKHRNHLGIRTASAQAVDGGLATTYDFATAQSQAFQDAGISTNAAMAQDGSKHMMWAGDANQDGYVRQLIQTTPVAIASDPDEICTIIACTAGMLSGYSRGDVNMDGKVRYTTQTLPTTIIGDVVFILGFPLGGNPNGTRQEHK